MAENIGEAQLRLTVDLNAFRDSLREASALLNAELTKTTVGGTGRGRGAGRRTTGDSQQTVRRALGGAREGIRALEIAQERRFRIARRIDSLEERGADVARLRVRLGQLTDTQIRRQFGSFRQVSQELARQVTLEERRLQTQQRQERAARKQATLGARMGGASESINALENAQDRRFRLSQRINRLEDRGVSVAKLREGLGELTASYAKREFGTARQLSRELDRQVALTEQRARRQRDIQRVTEQQRREALRTAAQNASPITGRTAAGAIPGSPADIRRQIQEGLRVGRLNALPVTGRTPTGPIPGSPADKEAQRRAQQRAEQERAREQRAAAAEQRRQQQEEQRQQRAALTEQRRLQREQAQQERARRAEESRAAREQQQERVRALREAKIRDAEQRQADRQAQQQERSRVQAERRQQQEQQRQERIRRAEEARAAREAKAAQTAGARQQRAQEAEARRIGRLNSSPISGRLPGGVLIPGSPAFKQKERREEERLQQQQAQQQVREQQRQQAAAQRAEAQRVREAERAAQRAQRAEEVRAARAAREAERNAARAQREEQLRAARQQREQERAEAARRKEIEKQRRREAAKRKPIGERLQAAGGDALIGGAFPALFGQGLGASVGGSLGGGLGGLIGGNFGFGLSLVGTAVGAQFDEAIRKFKILGEALNDPIGQLGALSDAGLISSKGLEKQIQALIDTGREADAAALIQKDLANTYGELQGAKELAASSDELGRSWAQLQATIAELAASPLSQVFDGVSDSLKTFTTLLQDLDSVLPKPLREAGFNVLKFGFNTTAGLGPNILQMIGRAGISQDDEIAARRKAAEQRDAAAADKLASSDERITEQRQLRLRLISAEAQGQEELALQLERQSAELEKQVALENSRARNESPLKQQEIAAKFNEQLLRLDERRLALERERTAEVRRRVDIERAASNELARIRDQFAVATKQADNENATARENLGVQQRRAGGLGSAGAAALGSVNSIEAAKREVQLAQVRQTAAQNSAIRAEREALILRDRVSTLVKEGASQKDVNSAEQAALAARNAAEQARNEYELGGKALETAGVAVKTSAFQAKADLSDLLEGIQDTIRSLSRNIEDSVGSLRRLQNTRGEGLNQFLSAQQVSDRQAAVGRQLAPEAQRLAEQLGVRFSVSGTREQINAQLLDFIEAARNELRISEDIGQAQRELAKATNDLTTINDALKTVTGELATLTGQLAENTAALASKDWNVYVNASASGDLPRGVEVYQQ